MMGIIIWLIVGGLIGWIASMIMKTDGQQGIFLNIIVGIVGAMIGGFLWSLLTGVKLQTNRVGSAGFRPFLRKQTTLRCESLQSTHSNPEASKSASKSEGWPR